MSDKKIPKEKLDEMLRLTHSLYNDGAVPDETIQKNIRLAKSLCGGSILWMSFFDLVCAVERMAQGDKNEAMYKVMEVLGWTVE